MVSKMVEQHRILTSCMRGSNHLHVRYHIYKNYGEQQLEKYRYASETGNVLDHCVV